MTSQSLVQTLRQVWDILRQSSVPAAVVGGLAMAIWKYPRSTRDIDILILLDDRSIPVLTRELAGIGLTQLGQQRIELGDVELLQFATGEEAVRIKLDLLCAKSPFARSALERRVVVTSEAMGFEVQTLRCEDLILLKLAAGRIIDRADAAALVRANAPTLDRDQMRKIALDLRLSGRLEEVFAEANR